VLGLISFSYLLAALSEFHSQQRACTVSAETLDHIVERVLARAREELLNVTITKPHDGKAAPSPQAYIAKAASSRGELDYLLRPVVRWAGGANGQRCISAEERWQGSAKARSCHGKNINWPKVYFTQDSRLEYQGRCLDATSVDVDQAIAVKPCGPVAEQQWDYSPSPDQSTRRIAPLRNKGTGLCLAVNNSNYPETIIMKRCDSSCQLLWNASLGEPVVSLQSYNKRIQTQSPRVVCWIMTHIGNRGKAIAINNTWGQRCTHLIFVSGRPDPSLPVFVANLHGKEDSRDMLRPKAKQGWLHVYENYLDKGDFFLKGDDDTYVMMSNLKVLGS
jgi:hypothetical protein